MMIWPEVQFEKLFSEPQRNGLYKEKKYHGSGAKIVNMGELFAYRFVGPQDMKRLQISDSEYQRFGLNDDDLLFARRSLIEAGAGKCVIVEGVDEEMVFESSLIRVRLDQKRCSSRFYFYYFSCPPGRSRVEEIITGAAQKGIRGTELARVVVHLPPLSTQRKTAAILSAYDDLIENNLRRIKILEEMAQNLYREWFVKFRFPGYQHARFVDSPLGRIPEGWMVLPVRDLGGKVVLGGTPARNNPLYWENGTIPWLKSGKLNDHRVMDGTEFITDEGLRESATKMMPPKTVLIAITGAILVSFLEIDACANQSVAGVFSLKKCSSEYLHLYLSENISLLESKMSGSAQQHVNKSIVEDIPVLIPSSGATSQFAQFAEPQYEIVANLLRRNTALRRTRDLLLPRLISGEVDVSELDIAVPEETVT
jgi:type I restriction enzyme S subunit